MQYLASTKKRYSNPQLSQRGAGLIEVLVAMVILAVGLLGMAGITAASIQYNQTSRMRGTGVLLVNDLAERARINISGFDAGKYSREETYNFSFTPTQPTGCTPTPGDTCDAAGLAEFDMQQWLVNVNNRLPAGGAYIATATDATGSIRTMNVTLIWTEPVDIENNLTQACPLKPNGDPVVDPNNKGARCMNFRVTL